MNVTLRLGVEKKIKDAARRHNVTPQEMAALSLRRGLAVAARSGKPPASPTGQAKYTAR